MGDLVVHRVDDPLSDTLHRADARNRAPVDRDLRRRRRVVRAEHRSRHALVEPVEARDAEAVELGLARHSSMTIATEPRRLRNAPGACRSPRRPSPRTSRRRSVVHPLVHREQRSPRASSCSGSLGRREPAVGRRAQLEAQLVTLGQGCDPSQPPKLPTRSPGGIPRTRTAPPVPDARLDGRGDHAREVIAVLGEEVLALFDHPPAAVGVATISISTRSPIAMSAQASGRVLGGITR